MFEFLNDFCGTRPEMERPFSDSGNQNIYATNGFLLICVPASSITFALNNWTPDLHEKCSLLLEPFLSQSLSPEDIVNIDITKIPPEENYIKCSCVEGEITCDKCDGTGSTKCECEHCKGHKCDQCDGIGKFDCEECDGTGKIEKINLFQIGKYNRIFNGKFIRLIMKLPEAQFYDITSEANNNGLELAKEPIFFTFKINDIFCYGIIKPCYLHVDIEM